MEKECIVNVQQGKLEGKFCKGQYRHDYYSFKGIPYARPPIGELRFKAPVPPENWYGIRDATKEGNASLSRSQTKQITGNEDCLYLNVYTKQLPSPDEPVSKPVMFWIHGGGFTAGSGNQYLFGPDYLLSKDIVLVTINYRLGVLGFLSLEDPSLRVPGNAGLKDMVMALQWVQNNISNFGGDPNCVTIFGESSGGAAVHLLILSPMSKGLFHRAIAQSGTAVSPWAYCIRRGFKFAEALGAKPKNEKEVLEFLKNVPAEKLVVALERVNELNDRLSFRMVGPIVEIPSGTEPTFLPRDPDLLLIDGQINDVPLIVGYNDADGMIYTSKTFKNRLVPVDFTDPEDLIPRNMKLERSSLKSLTYGVEIRKFYYGADIPSQKNLSKYLTLQTDLNFALMAKDAVKLQLAVSSQRVFLYRFSYDSPCNLYRKFYGVNAPGAAHGDELTYLFHSTFANKFGDSEHRTIDTIVSLWTSFAQNGIPGSEGLDVWHPVDGDKFNHLDIGKELKYKDYEPDKERMQFWNKLYADL